MALPARLAERAQHQCELCTAPLALNLFQVTSSRPRDSDVDSNIVVCGLCMGFLTVENFSDGEHWRCLGNSMWSTVPAVQVMAWRILSRLRDHTWAQDCLDILYLDEDTLSWAKDGWSVDAKQLTKDSNGVVLRSGDSVTIVKDLDVKGTSFTAKRGTIVRAIALTDNPEHIEGRVNDTRIVLLTCYVKKL